jgi:hypothetical protein
MSQTRAAAGGTRLADPALLRGLFDDAALFPPASLDMPAALAGHLRHAGAWYRDMTGLFVCSDSQLWRLRAVMTAANVPRIALALLVPGGAAELGRAVEAARADPRLALQAVELPLQAAGPATAAAARALAAALDKVLPAGVTGLVELPPGTCTAGVLEVLAEHRYRGKLRTGGTSAAAFPGEDELAGALTALAAARLPVKCTAGLHRAVRHTAAGTGFEHHGFLNVLCAAAAAAEGADPGALAAVLAERDPARVAARTAGLRPDQVLAARSALTSIGTCSIDEPVADLIALGLAGPAARSGT